MTFVSYAQNFEDVILWRALKHVEGGFYLDVGAWSPDADSITRAFYERGWRGINIEPNLEWNAQLNAKRPEDINLPVAISDVPGTETFYFFANLGLSTMDATVAQAHITEGWTAEPGEVTVTTLNAVWDAHVGDRAVHFLKVDVEGLEERVLRGNDWRAHRPWIVVVESTRPMSQVETHETWEPMLLGADYRLAYQDGLNRYYVAAEHAELMAAMKYPPNVFDRFVLVAQQEAEHQAAAAIARATEAELRAAEAEAHSLEHLARAAEAQALAAETLSRATAAEARADGAEARATVAEASAVDAEARAAAALAQADEVASHLHNVYQSKSWRYTAPIRWLKGPLASLRLLKD